jgi:hypothetical protein
LIEQINRVSSIQDDDYREPVQQAIRAPRKTAPGQVKWFSDDRARPTKAGSESESQGYVLFRYVDLNQLSIVLQQGDRIVKMGTIEVDVYVVELRPEGHYPDLGGPGLVKAFFRDRHPSKQTRGGQ